jgi:Leucine-rich repeat (LRR) protein
MHFQEMREINLKNNFIEEITENIFNNLPNLFELDLSNNRIRTIAPNSFVGLNFLVTLALDNNFLKSLETISNDNRTVSFLHPLNQILAFFSASDNFIEDLNPLKHMINLDNVTLSWNRIRRLEGNTFDQATNLRTLDFSFNQIEYIDSMAFNGTIVNDLNLAGNPFSSMETSVQQNQTTSFLYPISSTIFSLSLSNCMNLIEINWFVISKMEILSKLELSQLNKTDQFWLYRQTDINSEESIINWGFPPHIILNNIRFTDNDHCLTKPIDHILNRTTLIVDIDHPCNCFIFKFKDIYDQDQRPICLSNDFIVNQLTNQCSNMDSYCESFLNGTTSSSSSPMNTNTTPRSTSTTTVTASVNTTNVQISSSAVTTTTQTPLKRSNKNQQTKIILATTIPILVIIILFLTVVYILKRKKKNNLGENFEMKLNNPMYKS